MADFIYNNNYLLSNLDAQKLYAQSPLTTGVSGSSAYIGLEPSARYNETVLFSGVNAWGYGTIPLSESLKNFQRIKVLATRAYSADNNTNRFSGPWCEFDCDGIANTTASWGAVTPAIYEAENWKYSVFTANSTFTELNWYKGGYINVQDLSHGNGSNWIDGKSVGIKAVIGINRKEV